MPAEKVAAASLKDFRAGDTVIAPGVSNKARALMSRLMHRKLYAAVTGKGMKR